MKLQHSNYRLAVFSGPWSVKTLTLQENSLGTLYRLPPEHNAHEVVANSGLFELDSIKARKVLVMDDFGIFEIREVLFVRFCEEIK